tara:strand:- start:989 stop:1099 length:111 start_codon:yes stop_codon:yes gene_type:complete
MKIEEILKIVVTIFIGLILGMKLSKECLTNPNIINV